MSQTIVVDKIIAAKWHSCLTNVVNAPLEALRPLRPFTPFTNVRIRFALSQSICNAWFPTPGNCFVSRGSLSLAHWTWRSHYWFTTVSFSSRRDTSCNSNVRGLSFIAVLYLGEQANDATACPSHWPIRRQVCKSLNHIIKTYSGMQHIIELDTNGMEATSYTLLYVDLLEKLRDRLKAWEQLDRKPYRVITHVMPVLTSS